MIEIKDLTKKFEDDVLFSGLNLQIDDGEFVVVTGTSGCGKTTLLNIIGGIEDYDSGTVTVDGIDIGKKKNQLDFFKTKVGFLFQNFALIDNKTVEDNLKIVKKDAKSSVTIEEALKRVGLSDKIDQKVYKLSGGEQQRVALARLMIKKCDLILADEPTGSLDTGNAEEVLKILKSLNEEGKTVLLVTHDERIKKWGTRVIDLSEYSSRAKKAV